MTELGGPGIGGLICLKASCLTLPLLVVATSRREISPVRCPLIFEPPRV